MTVKIKPNDQIVNPETTWRVDTHLLKTLPSIIIYLYTRLYDCNRLNLLFFRYPSDTKSPQLSPNLSRIKANLNIAIIWQVLIFLGYLDSQLSFPAFSRFFQVLYIVLVSCQFRMAQNFQLSNNMLGFIWVFRFALLLPMKNWIINQSLYIYIYICK